MKNTKIPISISLSSLVIKRDDSEKILINGLFELIVRRDESLSIKNIVSNTKSISDSIDILGKSYE